MAVARASRSGKDRLALGIQAPLLFARLTQRLLHKIKGQSRWVVLTM
jgi:hypothetical protein